MKYRLAALLTILLSTAALNAFAEEGAVSAPAAETRTPNFLEDHARPYGRKCMEKLDFGMQNLMTGWTQIISVPAERHAAQKGMRPIAAGIAEGFLLGFADTLGGFLNAVTFPIPAKFPLPKGGVNTGKITAKK